MTEDEYDLLSWDPPKPFKTAVEARQHVLKQSRKVIDTAAKQASGELSMAKYRGDPDVLRQYLVIIARFKVQDDPISIPEPVLKKLRKQPKECHARLTEVFQSFLEGYMPLAQLNHVLEGFSHLFEMSEIREISNLPREQKQKFGRKRIRLTSR